MSPEQIGNSNMWILYEGESVVGSGGEIKGPVTVRVSEFPDDRKILVQAGKIKVEVDRSDFETVVKKSR